MLGVGEAIFDIFYPVGSYYETSDTTFNPNTAHSWYGTWVEDTAGRVLVAQDTTQTEFDVVGETGGSKYLQKHIHMVVGGYGGSLGTNDNSDRPATMRNSSGTRSVAGFTTSQAQKGYNDSSLQLGESGNLQPYIVIKRWHRTA